MATQSAKSTTVTIPGVSTDIESQARLTEPDKHAEGPTKIDSCHTDMSRFRPMYIERNI